MVSIGPPPINFHRQPFAWVCVPPREVRGETSAWSRAESQHQIGDEHSFQNGSLRQGQ